MIFASTTKLLKKLIKNIKQHFKNFYWSSVSPTNQDLFNDTTFGQIKSRVPVPLSMVNFLHIMRHDVHHVITNCRQFGYLKLSVLFEKGVQYTESDFQIKFLKMDVNCTVLVFGKHWFVKNTVIIL